MCVCKLEFTLNPLPHTYVHHIHKVYHQNPPLLIHIRMHIGDKLYKCDVCCNRFSENGNLQCTDTHLLFLVCTVYSFIICKHILDATTATPVVVKG
jgi:hypothetical protein